MKLAVDIGNSTIALGFLDDSGSVRDFFKIRKDEVEEQQMAFEHVNAELKSRSISCESVDMVCVSSVVPTVTEAFEGILRRFFGCPIRRLEPGMSSLVDCSGVSSELGGDIYANLVAARFKHPDRDLIVVDFGTATTIAGVRRDGRIVGVSISCGIHTSLNAICGKAELLGGVMLDSPVFSLGTNSKDALISGALFSALGMLQCCISYCSSSFHAKPYVVATGGASEYFRGRGGMIDEFDENNTVLGIVKSFETSAKEDRK